MRIEIGSEFWDIPTSEKNQLFPKNTKWFISGRSALKAIIRDNHFKTAALPDWCCESMVIPFIDEGIKVSFYSALSSEIRTSADVVLILDYLGYIQDTKLCDFDGVIIRDVTHSIFSVNCTDADYCFGSLRKWAGFSTAGFAWGFKSPVSYEEPLHDFVNLKRSAMAEKKAYINEQTRVKNYFDGFNTAEDMLENIGVLPADPEDVVSALKLDVSFIRNRRRKNAQILLEAFHDIAIFPELKNTECPLFVPIKVKNRDGLRSHLIQKEIYCPIHWPKAACHTDISPVTGEIYDSELSLICDQRYDERDMQRIIKEILFFRGDLKC